MNANAWIMGIVAKNDEELAAFLKRLGCGELSHDQLEEWRNAARKIVDMSKESRKKANVTRIAHYLMSEDELVKCISSMSKRKARRILMWLFNMDTRGLKVFVTKRRFISKPLDFPLESNFTEKCRQVLCDVADNA